ncbi:helix-turn-helix domain-containing protein [Nonomuraea indica]|uniref:Helix-turn-helix domain-containing protein n=1 Tax=Nonomuraea indica TaxID=1581193 RepID=A0ABW7ZVY7_9ACTN
MVDVRGHWRKTKKGWTWVREHTRQAPRTAKTGAGVGVLIVMAALFIGPNIHASDPTQVGATSAPTPPITAHATLAQALSEARQHAGFSIVGASQQAGISSSRISEIERGLVKPTADEIDVLSRTYRLTIDEWAHMVTLLEKVP